MTMQHTSYHYTNSISHTLEHHSKLQENSISHIISQGTTFSHKYYLPKQTNQHMILQTKRACTNHYADPARLLNHDVTLSYKIAMVIKVATITATLPYTIMPYAK